MMNKNLIILVIVLLALGFVIYFFVVRGGNDTGTQQSSATNSYQQTQPDNFQSKRPDGDTFLIGTSQGGVEVRNFYRDKVRVFESDVFLKEKNEYDVTYHIGNSSFSIVILKNPVDNFIRLAERDLLEILDIDKSEACKLNISVVVPFTVDKAKNGIRRLSFCPGAVELQQ